jgi:hypothetical protein
VVRVIEIITYTSDCDIIRSTYTVRRSYKIYVYVDRREVQLERREVQLERVVLLDRALEEAELVSVERDRGFLRLRFLCPRPPEPLTRMFLNGNHLYGYYVVGYMSAYIIINTRSSYLRTRQRRAVCRWRQPSVCAGRGLFAPWAWAGPFLYIYVYIYEGKALAFICVVVSLRQTAKHGAGRSAGQRRM